MNLCSFNEFQVLLAQIDVKVGDIEYNTSVILQYLNKYSNSNSSIVIFPPMVLTGVLKNECIYDRSLIYQEINSIKEIQKYAKYYTNIIFSSYLIHDNKLFNAVIVYSQDEQITFYISKESQLNSFEYSDYTINDDSKLEYKYIYTDNILLNYNDFQINIFCDDIIDIKKIKKPNVHKISKFSKYIIVNLSKKIYAIYPDHNLYEDKNPVNYIVNNNFNDCDIYINIGHLSSIDNILYFSETVIIDNINKSIIGKLKRFIEDVSLFKINDSSNTITTNNLKYISNNNIINTLDYNELFYTEILTVLSKIKYDYFKYANIKKSIIGISGGIDSAVTLCLDIIALGSENVIAILMPSRYSKLLDESIELCKNLNVKYYIINLEYKEGDKWKGLIPIKNHILRNNLKLTEPIVFENQQSIQRMSILRAIANNFNGLVAGTSNKSEFAMGYSTICGDLSADIFSIADLYKTQVYHLAYYINKNYSNMIPSSIINNMPSAELSYNQKDPFDYKLLDQFLYLYIEKKYTINYIISLKRKYDFDIIEINKWLKRLHYTGYKRNNTSMILKLTSNTFGFEFKFNNLSFIK